jgi:glutaminase
VSELTYAASDGDLDTVRILVARGVRVNAGDYDGRTTMHLAVAEGRTDIVKFLLDKGTKVLSCPTSPLKSNSSHLLYLF